MRRDSIERSGYWRLVMVSRVCRTFKLFDLPDVDATLEGGIECLDSVRSEEQYAF